MPHVIGEKCLGEQYAACVDVCPVESVHPVQYKNEPFMIIDPETCIDCGVCLPECPVGAIVGSVDEDPDWAQINKDITQEAKDYEAKHGKITPRPANDPPRKPGHTLVK